MLHIASFIIVCEAYLGIEPHVDLFTKFFSGRAWSEEKGRPSLPAPVGGFTLQMKLKVVYPPYTPNDSNRGWHSEWFYIWNPIEALFPEFTGGRPTRQDS